MCKDDSSILTVIPNDKEKSFSKLTFLKKKDELNLVSIPFPRFEKSLDPTAQAVDDASNLIKIKKL